MRNNLLIDLDGTLYRGDEPIPEAKEFVGKLQRGSVPFLLLTNCPLNSPRLLSEKLSKMEIFVPPERILTSGSACVQYLAEKFPEETVLVIGSESFLDLAVTHGLRLWKNETEIPKAVAVGYAPELDYEQLSLASHYLRNGAVFLATNGDAAIPSGERLVPHTGAVVEYLKTASGKTPLIIGKPYAYMLNSALKQLGCKKEDCLVLGDGLSTDYAFAVRNGLDYRIVLTGVTTREETYSYGVPPDKLLESLSAFTFS